MVKVKSQRKEVISPRKESRNLPLHFYLSFHTAHGCGRRQFFETNKFDAILLIICAYLNRYEETNRYNRNKVEMKYQTPNLGNPEINPFCCFPLTNQCNVLFSFSELRRSTSILHSSPSSTCSF